MTIGSLSIEVPEQIRSKAVRFAQRRYWQVVLRPWLLSLTDSVPLQDSRSPMSKKFSALAVAAVAALVTVADRQSALKLAEDAADKATDDVVAALKSVPKQKVALVAVDGVNVYSLTPSGFSYTVETIAGDFDLPDPGEEPAADPEPTDPPEADGPVS